MIYFPNLFDLLVPASAIGTVLLTFVALLLLHAGDMTDLSEFDPLAAEPSESAQTSSAPPVIRQQHSNFIPQTSSITSVPAPTPSLNVVTTPSRNPFLQPDNAQRSASPVIGSNNPFAAPAATSTSAAPLPPPSSITPNAGGGTAVDASGSSIVDDTAATARPTGTASLAPAALRSGEGSWKLKTLTWPDPRVGGYRREVRVLTQNANGPCSLLALANALILRGSIHIPADRQSIDYDQLASLIGDFLVERVRSQSPGAPSLSLSAALDILPTTTRGLDVNVGFTSIRHFEPIEGHDNGELALFSLAGVDLVHGWLAEPSASDPETYEAIERAGRTYEQAQMSIVTADDQTRGDAAVLRRWLDATRSQITYPGLFALSTGLEPGSVVALFRNSHLSVLYRRHKPSGDDDDSTDQTMLYQLVTDSSFAREREIAWESIVDVDGSGAAFYDAEFRLASSAGGDYSGMTAGQAAVRAERSRLNGQELEQRGEFGDEE